MSELEQYLEEHYWAEDDLLRALRADIAERGPQIQVSAEAGRLLSLLVRAVGATRVLEVGTLFGYSGIWIARELPEGGHLDTIEIETLHAEAAEHWFQRAGLADKVTVHRGAGADVLPASRAHTTRRSSMPTRRGTPATRGWRSSGCGRGGS